MIGFQFPVRRWLELFLGFRRKKDLFTKLWKYTIYMQSYHVFYTWQLPAKSKTTTEYPYILQIFLNLYISVCLVPLYILGQLCITFSPDLQGKYIEIYWIKRALDFFKYFLPGKIFYELVTYLSASIWKNFQFHFFKSPLSLEIDFWWDFII